METKEYFKNKKRVVVKIGSSSLHHEATGKLNFTKLEKLVRELCDIRNQGLDVCLVGDGVSGASQKYFHEAGMCSRGAGKAYDDVSEDVCRIPPGGGTGSDDKGNYA